MSNLPSRVIVRADRLLAIEPFQSIEETRYYLCGTYIVPHPERGAVMVTTDGHFMAVVYDQDAHIAGLPQIWKPQAKARLAKIIAEGKKSTLTRYSTKEPETQVWADLRDKEVGGPPASVSIVKAVDVQQVLDGKGEILASIPGTLVIDGSFPEWYRVFKSAIPQDQPAASHSLRADYSKRVGDLAVALHPEGDKAAQVRYWECSTTGGGGQPLRITFPKTPWATVIMMPMRDGQEADRWAELPWIDSLFGRTDNVVPLPKAA